MQAGMIKKTQRAVKPDNFLIYGKIAVWCNKHPVADSFARVNDNHCAHFKQTDANRPADMQISRFYH
ncbi:MAG: hypothetical protein ACRC0C_12560 [Gibbsiella quercinecans]